MPRRRSWWFIYAVCATAVLGALVGVSVLVLKLERAERAARGQAAHQEALRLALWRMDSWLAPLLAREAARPYFEYVSYYPQERAYTRLLTPIEVGEVLNPSPLLTFRSEYFRLHFQLDPETGLTSPQVPLGDLRDLAEATCLPAEVVSANRALLEGIGDLLDPGKLRAMVTRIEESVAAVQQKSVIVLPAEAQGDDPRGQVGKTKAEWAYRARNTLVAKQAAQTSQQVLVSEAQQEVQTSPPAQMLIGFPQQADDTLGLGPLVPVWLGEPGDGEGEALYFLRRVRIGKKEIFQGFLADWATLRTALLSKITDLFPAAALTPVREVGADESGRLMATVPVCLTVGSPRLAPAALVSPARATLGLTWLGVGLALVAAGITLRSSIAFGEKRSRFASAVTHELRTPLTTFRMYSEMLADGMVTDEQTRREYLVTLRASPTVSPPSSRTCSPMPASRTAGPRRTRGRSPRGSFSCG